VVNKSIDQSIFFFKWLYSPLWASASSTKSLQASEKIGSGFTYKCDLPVHHLPVGSDWLSEAVL
jgi:hypothetical protein